MTPLRQRFIEDMHLRGLAPTTQRSYIHYVADFARFYNTSPEKLDLEAVYQGKLRFPGITAVGDTPALHQVLDSRAFVSAQVSYNMLNPSAAEALLWKMRDAVNELQWLLNQLRHDVCSIKAKF